MKSPQSCQMDLGSPFTLLSVCVMTVCLLGAARCSNDKRCPCPDVPRKDRTVPPAENCFQINQTFRYKCEGDNKRKAGTSNLIRCKQTDNLGPHWAPPNLSLECIPDPSRTTTQPPESTATKAHTDIPHDSTIATTVNKISCPCPEVPRRHLTLPPTENCFQINQYFRYDCEGDNKRKAGTSNLIRCTQTDNDSPHWVPSNLSLECIPDPSRTTTQPPESTATTGKEQDVWKTKAPHQTTATSTTAEPSNNGTSDAHALPPAARTAIGCASVVIVCALIGIIFYCYRRRSKRYIPPQGQEEQMPMKPPEH